MSKASMKEKELTLPEKLKQLLRIKSVAPQTDQSLKGRPDDYALTADIIKDISTESSISQRIKTMKRLMDEMHGKKLQEHGVETIWVKIRDLIYSQQPKTIRQSVFEFMNFIVISQYDWLGMMRAKIFEVIAHSGTSEDLVERIELLKYLTKSGREIEHFEEAIGRFVHGITVSALESSSAVEYLSILINLLKFHSSYLDENVVQGTLSQVCFYACCTSENEGIVLCLQVLDAVIGYSWLLKNSLDCIVTTLCRTVNVEKYSQSSLKIVRNLLGTHLGHSGLYAMCNILEQPGNRDDVALLRGAIFFTGMCLWGSQRVPSLKLTYSVVLPYFLKALGGEHATVAVEVSLSLLRLVKKYGKELQPETWDLTMAILETLIRQSKGKTDSQSMVFASNVHEIITLIEQLYVDKHFIGCEKKLFSLIEKCLAKRPESSVLRLLNYQLSSINPLKSNWLNSLKLLMDTYFKHEKRTNIRVKVLETLGEIYRDNQFVYEDDIVEKIILPCLNHIETDFDVDVRNAAVKLLLMASHDCSSKSCLEILEILAKVVGRPFDPALYAGGKAEAQETVHVVTEAEIVDVKEAILGLIKLFEKKLYELPSSIVITIYKILLKHLHLQYESSLVLKDAGVLRIAVFECFLNLRADEHHRMGIVDAKAGTKFSSYLLCSYSDKLNYGTTSPPLMSPTPFSYPTASPTYVSLDRLFQVLSICLKQEKDWCVLKYVLLELPKLLQNKTLLLSSAGSIVNLCQGVCALISDRGMKLPETLRNAPVTLSRPEFHLHVYPIQVALVSYHKYLDANVQHLLVSCLKHGLTSKCAPTCVSAFTICILEMTNTMYKLLPAVLLSLSKISATVNIATSILEFLSTLIRLPNLYASFVQEQYMSIFAIAVPYTNPFKFNHYTVSLAHHVIAMWFIKCRISYRKDFVRFIVKGLRNNVILPLTEGTTHSEGRSRGDKEHEQGTTHKKPNKSEVLTAFHCELAETCNDLLSRYTFAGCSTLPKRSPIAEFLLTLGQSATWIIGNTVVTITTSGCSVRASRQGLCDKCHAFCKKGVQESAVPDPPVGSTDSTRRRHRSAAVRRSLSIDSQEKIPRAKDDLQILRMRNKDDSILRDDDENGDEETPTFSSLSDSEPRVCSCWCQEWAEILVRRPTGNTSWMMRIQNQLRTDDTSPDFPLSDLTNLIFSCHQQRQISRSITKFGHERIDSEGLDETPLIPELISDLVLEKGDVKASAPSSTEETKHPAQNSIKSKEAGGAVNIGFQATESLLEKRVETVEQFPLRKPGSIHDLKTDLRDSLSQSDCKPLGENLERNSPLDSTLTTELKQEKDQKLGVHFEGVETTDSHIKLEETMLRRESGGKLKGPPLRLPDIRERQIHSPVYNTASAPLSPLPLLQPGVLNWNEDIQPSPRDRCNTIAVMSPVRPKWFPGTSTSAHHRVQEGQHQGINPSFVFLQLYHSYRFENNSDRPIYLAKSDLTDRALKVLDHIPPYDTHKIGVLYVGKNQADCEAEILANEFGSVRYVTFLEGLGNLVRLKDVNSKELYVGGLDLSGPDGKFAYVWKDDVMQVIFHVATLMPTKKTDPCCNQKKLHIGNDFVSIVYNDSGRDYNIHTIKGQFIYACVIIQPLDSESNLVSVKTKPELSVLLGTSDPKIVSENNLAILVRQLALHANLASMILQSQQRSRDDPYASNWLERLRQIRRIREKRLAEAPPPRDDDSPGHNDSAGSSLHNLDDFTQFV